MKTNIRNILIIIFYLTGIPFWRRLFLRRPAVRVWLLHEVKDSQISQFEKKIQYLQKKYHIISPQDFVRNNLSEKKLNILISFDDGFESWFANVLPILEKYQIKAIFFISKEFQYLKKLQGGVKFFNNDRFDEYIQLISASGHSLGGHSITHQRLTELSPDEQHREIWQSVKSKFFAYPFGDRHSYNKRIITEVRDAGYSYSFRIIPGFNTQKTNPYLLNRDSLDSNVSDLIFRLWFKGCYDWKKWL